MRTNRLLGLLERDGDRTVANLKRRYRLLCLREHPDHSGRHEAFLRLNAEYRDAMALLSGRSQVSSPIAEERSPPVKTRAETRAATLDSLRTFAFKFYCRESEAQLDKLIRAATEYDPIRARLLHAYRASFLDTYHAWLSDGRVYYPHAVLISAVRQLFYFFDTRSTRHALLLERYLQDAKTKARTLSSERRKIIEIFTDWVGEEGKEPLS